jgi:hypothetical protein
MVDGLLSALWEMVVYDRWPWFRGCMRGNDFFRGAICILERRNSLSVFFINLLW